MRLNKLNKVAMKSDTKQNYIIMAMIVVQIVVATLFTYKYNSLKVSYAEVEDRNIILDYRMLNIGLDEVPSRLHTQAIMSESVLDPRITQELDERHAEEMIKLKNIWQQ